MEVSIAETIDGEKIDNLVSQNIKSTSKAKKGSNWFLLLIYLSCSTVGCIGGPMLQRLYYSHGGTRQWLSSWLQSIGFFITLPLILIPYLKSLSVKNLSHNGFFMDLKLSVASSFVGLGIGLINYMYSTGLACLPVSTSTLLFSTQLAFTALFSLVVVKQKFTFYSMNAVIVMIFSAVALALHTDGDRPPGVSKGKYLFGFFISLGGSALWGLLTPLIELSYRHSSKPVTYLIVLQAQVVMYFFAAMVATVGVLVSKDFQAIPTEAREFELGEKKYYVLLATTAVVWQLGNIGITGVISYKSSLFFGILNSTYLPMTEVAGVTAFHENFTAEKGFSLALCIWGIISYLVGDYKQSGKTKPIVNGNEVPLPSTDIETPSQVEFNSKR